MSSHSPHLWASKLIQQFPKAIFVVSKNRDLIPEDVSPDV